MTKVLNGLKMRSVDARLRNGMSHFQFQVGGASLSHSKSGSHLDSKAGGVTCVIGWKCGDSSDHSTNSRDIKITHLGLYGKSFGTPTRFKLPVEIERTVDGLRRYFEHGEPVKAVDWSLLDSSSWTDFQFRVYRAILDIPHGETRTYSWVASRLGKGGATRAVGQALRKNPLPILIPCHRVVSQGSIGGFMGSTDPNEPELLLKKRLIEIEEKYISPMFDFLALEPATQWIAPGVAPAIPSLQLSLQTT